MIELADAGDANATNFFKEEYQLDHFIATMDTPFVAIMDGITSKLLISCLHYILTLLKLSGWWCRIIRSCSFPYCY